MRYTLTTKNPFHDGWMAALLGLPCDPPKMYDGAQQQAYGEGYNTAIETTGLSAVTDVVCDLVQTAHLTVTVAL